MPLFTLALSSDDTVSDTIFMESDCMSVLSQKRVMLCFFGGGGFVVSMNISPKPNQLISSRPGEFSIMTVSIPLPVSFNTSKRVGMIIAESVNPLTLYHT